jgi:hypothetical protein
MWLLNFIPVEWLHLIVFILMFSGLGLYTVGLLINFCPLWVKSYREPIRILSTVLLVAGIYGYGMFGANSAWQDKINEVEKRVAEAEKRAAETNTQIEYVYKDRVQVVRDVQYKTLEVIRKDASKIDATCRVDPEVVTILNTAAQSVNSGDKK